MANVWRYTPLAATVRGDHLGPQRLRGLLANTRYNRALFGVEHIAITGEHNVREIPRVCRRIVYSAGYTISPSSTDITAVSSGSTGVVDLTLAGSRFLAPNMRFEVTVEDGAAAKPYMTSVLITSAASITVRIWKLTDALATTNTWALTNASFSIAIHSDPLAAGSWSSLPPYTGMGVAQPLPDYFWSLYPPSAAELYSSMTAAHTSAGDHTAREVPYLYGAVGYSGGTYSLDYGHGEIGSITRSSAGVIVVNYSALASAPSVFPVVNGVPDRLYAVTTTPGTTSTTFHLFYYDTETVPMWRVADADFYFSAYQGP